MVTVPLQLRENERRQLTEEFLPFVLADLSNIDSENEQKIADGAQALEQYSPTRDEYPLEDDEWRAIITELQRAKREHSLRSDYLQRKLFRRFKRRVEEVAQ